MPHFRDKEFKTEDAEDKYIYQHRLELIGDERGGRFFLKNLVVVAIAAAVGIFLRSGWLFLAVAAVGFGVNVYFRVMHGRQIREHAAHFAHRLDEAKEKRHREIIDEEKRHHEL